ncbi:MAG: PEGA domain-containing protein [Patescibacteria group bacterium]
MNHLTRRIIFWSFVFIFFVLTAYLFLLVNSYVISFSSFKDSRPFISLQKAGILAVDSNPRGASVYIERKFKNFLNSKDGEQKESIITPHKVKNLIPGEYSLRVELDGYWPFEKDFKIVSGQTTYIESIALLKKTLPLLISPREVQEIEISKDFSSIIFLDDKEIFDLKNEKDILISESINDLNFLGANRFLVNKNIIFDYAKNNYLFLDDEFYKDVENIKAHKNNFYFIKDEKTLFSYSLENNSQIIVVDSSKINDYYVNDEFVYLILEDSSKKFLKVYSLKNNEIVREIEINFNSNFKINNIIGSYVLLYDEIFSSLLIVEPFSRINTIRRSISDVKNISIIDGNSFIYSSDFEIYIFDLNLFQGFLISRLENEIGGVLWHPRSYLIFSSGNDIKAIDFKYDQQILNLFSLDNVGNIALDISGGALYFTGKIGRQEGLYKLYIQ